MSSITQPIIPFCSNHTETTVNCFVVHLPKKSEWLFALSLPSILTSKFRDIFVSDVDGADSLITPYL